MTGIDKSAIILGYVLHESESHGGKMKLFRPLAVTIVLFIPVPVFAQQSQNQWLIGHWDGTIEGFPASENSSRILRVHSVSADGKAVALWAVPGSNASQTETSTDGSGVKIVFQGTSVVIELTREGDTSLGGKYTNTSGKTFPIKFRKAKLSSEFDGEWEGPATNNPRNNRDCTNGTYRVTIKDSLITGTFEIPSRVAGVGLREALVTGEVQPDKSAILEIKPITPEMPSARFTGAFSGNQFHGSDPAVGTRRCGFDVDLKKR
jgi:hypothetical protein